MRKAQVGWRRIALCLLAGGFAAPARSQVTEFKIISSRTIVPSPMGRFGPAQPAEKFVAHAKLELDPSDPRNAVIADLDRAPRNGHGKIDYEAEVIVLRPANPNGLLLVELPNRGGSEIFGALDDLDHPAGDGVNEAGNGFLLAKGYALAVIGWQGDLPLDKKIAASLPVAKGSSGFSRDEWVMPATATEQTLTLSWPVADPASAQLFERSVEDGPSVKVPASRWHLVGEDRVEVTSPEPRAARVIYELRYRAKDSAVMGMGFAAVRDVTLFLEHDGGAANPLAKDGHSILTRSIATGISQSGRALRDFLYLGFNRDETGRRVFDGMLPIIPGTRRSFTNARFAQPGRNPGPEADQQYPVDQFPFTYDALTDSLSGRTDGILVRCRATQSCPKVIEFDSEYEFWGSRASLLVTDTRGKAIPLPGEVRAYMLAGAPHFNPWNAVSSRNPRCMLASSPVAAGPVIRALLADLDDWITKAEPPPESRYPSVAEGTLVPADDVYANGLPLPYEGQHLRAQWIEQTEGGPVVRGEYPVLLPKADADGIALAGIHLPMVSVPRATYVGWNPQANASGTQELCDHAAGMLPFARTKAERLAANDPRLSIEERYANRAAYHAAAVSAAEELVRDRLLLKEDAPVVVAEAEAID